MEPTSLTKALGLLEATAGHPDGRSLAAEIEQAEKLGYAIEENETDVGVACIGAAICAGDGPVGAISVSMPLARLDAASRRRLIDLVRKTAIAISVRLNPPPSRESPRKESR